MVTRGGLLNLLRLNLNLLNLAILFLHQLTSKIFSLLSSTDSRQFPWLLSWSTVIHRMEDFTTTGSSWRDPTLRMSLISSTLIKTVLVYLISMIMVTCWVTTFITRIMTCLGLHWTITMISLCLVLLPSWTLGTNLLQTIVLSTPWVPLEVLSSTNNQTL